MSASTSVVDLVAKLEFFQNLLDVGRKAVQVGLEVGLELLLLAPGPEVFKGERRDVVEGVPGLVAQRIFFGGDARVIELLTELEDGLLGGFQHRIQPADDGHRQDHIPVLAPDVHVPEDVIGNVPDEPGNPVKVSVGHTTSI